MFEALKAVPKSQDFSEPNPALERAIERIKSAYPQRFLQPHELKERKFFDEPASPTPMLSYVKPVPHYVPSPVLPPAHRAKPRAKAKK